MNKKLSSIIISSVIAGGTVASILFAVISDGRAEAIEEISAHTAVPLSSEKDNPYGVTAGELRQAEQLVGPVTDETTLLSRMIEMSFQKVNIGGELLTPKGIDATTVHRIPMTKSTIAYIQQCLEDIHVEKGNKYEYERILTQWTEGNFTDIVNEDKHLLGLLMGGNYTGESNTLKTVAEEENNVSYFFK